MRYISLAVVVGILACGTLARAQTDPSTPSPVMNVTLTGDQPDADMIAAAERVAAIIESGGLAAPGGAFADHGVTIIENFAPFIFEGPRAVERWSDGMRAHLTGVTGLRHSFGPAQDFGRSGDEAYFSLPTHWRGFKDGRAFDEDGGWAFVLTRHGGLWRVRGYGWAVTTERAE